MQVIVEVAPLLAQTAHPLMLTEQFMHVEFILVYPVAQVSHEFPDEAVQTEQLIVVPKFP